MIKENQTFTITENDAKRRIDRILRKFLPALPMSALYSALRLGKIKVNGKKVKPSYIAEKNDILEIVNLAIEDRGIKPSAQINMQIEDTEKKTIFKSAKPEILLKTEDLIFINKPKGQIVHGEKSLCEAVLQYFPSQIQSLSFTPGPLHRLDKNTSGIITFSQSLDGARQFSKALQEGKTGKYYIGITEGTKVKSVFKNTIDGKLCICYTKTLEISKKYNMSLVLFELITGKKHQIRRRSRAAISVSQPLPHTHQKHGWRETRQRANWAKRATERPLLRRKRNVCGKTPRHRHPSEIPQARGN